MADVKVAPGQFPYRITGEPEETRYLTWVRNHSNYMAERGFVDYMRIVAILIRGILINFIVLLPILLALAMFLTLGYGNALARLAEYEGTGVAALVKEWARIAPIVLTKWVLVVGLVWVLVFPILIKLFKVVAHQTAVRSGSDSSVKLRDLYERSFGAVLLGLIVALLIDVLPLIVHWFHSLRDLGYRGAAAGLAGGSSVLGLAGAGKLLSFLDQGKQAALKKALAQVFIGLLGILLPLVVVFYVAETLVYQQGISFDWWVLELVPGALAVGIVCAIALGRWKKTFASYWWLVWMLLGILALMFALWYMRTLFQDMETYNTELLFVAILAAEILLFCWLTVDVNLTSVHGLYRDRLATAYLVGQDTSGDVDIEQDIDLHAICQYENGSTAPYHLINVALNLQGSKDIGIRDRNSDFFIFSKRFIGSQRTGYCASTTMELVYPQMDLATAMAISAAAASPNMGAATSSLMVAVMTLFNVRLGYWIPNPGRIEVGKDGKPFSFDDIFAEEMKEIKQRWTQVYTAASTRPPRALASPDSPSPTNPLVGLGFSGGGIRSATINLGIAQALHASGVFDHVDYLSTVSGGGYLGSSISTLMRDARPPHDRGRPTPDTRNGTGSIKSEPDRQHTLRQRFRWRVRPTAFLREMASKLDETHRWVNLSDGGHIENLAGIELLRRQCKYIIIGDGEADPALHFSGLATLMRFARIDLGIHIDIDVEHIRPDDNNRSVRHWALGRVQYPGYSNEADWGYLLYLKSSYCGDEDEVITQYRSKNTAFPHESTADQFFDEGQFEAYRALGEHIGLEVINKYTGRERQPRQPKQDGADALRAARDKLTGFADFEAWMQELSRAGPTSARPAGA